MDKPIQEQIEEIFSRLESMNYYELLKVSRRATADEIRKAHRNLIRTMHPDRHASEVDDEQRAKLEQIFNEINTAFSVLSDEQERTNYDQNLYRADKAGVKTRRGTDVKTAESQFKRGLEALRKKEIVRAVGFFESAAKIKPDNAEYWAKLALAQCSHPRLHEQALESCRRALKLNHENPNYHAIMGRIYQKSGELEKALQHYRRALSWDPQHAVAKREIPNVKAAMMERKPTLKQKVKSFFQKSKKESPPSRRRRGDRR